MKGEGEMAQRAEARTWHAEAPGLIPGRARFPKHHQDSSGDPRTVGNDQYWTEKVSGQPEQYLRELPQV